MNNIQNSPTVSIGLPVFNGERFLGRALDSLLAQSFTDFEIILSDNASTDDTRSICGEYASKDVRIRYVRNDTNLGPLKNFNQVLELARGTYFMWAAYDDTWEPNYLSRLVDLLEDSPDAIFAFCSCDRLDTDGNYLRTHRKYGRLVHPNRFIRVNRYIWFPDGEGRVMIIYGLMHTSVLKDIGGIVAYDQFESSDDTFVLQLLLRGNFAFSEELLFHKCDVPESATFNKWGLSDWFAYYRDYRRVIWQSELSFFEKLILVSSVSARQVIFQLGKPPYRLLLSMRKRLIANRAKF
jgi:glycosyltransferase involved in cell wall biosynthesis